MNAFVIALVAIAICVMAVMLARRQARKGDGDARRRERQGETGGSSDTWSPSIGDSTSYTTLGSVAAIGASEACAVDDGGRDGGDDCGDSGDGGGSDGGGDSSD